MSGTKETKVKEITQEEMLKRFANMETSMAELQKDNKSLKKENATLKTSVSKIAAIAPAEKLQGGRPKPKASGVKTIEVEVSLAGGKTEKKVFEVSEIAKRENRIYDPLNKEFISVDALAENAKNGDASIINKIIEIQNGAKTPFKNCGIAPKK